MKPPGYDKAVLHKILLDPDISPLDNEGHTLPPSDEVFRTIAKQMHDGGSFITPKHIYTIVNENRNGFKAILLQKLNIFVDEQDCTASTKDENFSSITCENEIDSSSALAVSINVVISSEKWSAIRPEKKWYGKRLYWRLRAGWADVIAEAIWVQHKINCVITFKYNNVYHSKNAQHFLIIDGCCKECGTSIRGSLLHEPSENVDVMINVKFNKIIEKLHTNQKRRQLRGVRRRKAAEKMINGRKSAVILRREEARRLKIFGGKNPPTLPSSEVLRKAKEEHLVKKHGLTFKNAALNLQEKAQSGKFYGQIHHIALLKFCCIYWSKEQQQLYINRCRNDANAFLTIDATGGIAKRKAKQESHTFLYQCMLVTKDGSVPTFQMVTADHRALSVAYFLRLIIAANCPIPPTVVTDFGWALMIAVTEIFGKCSSFADYLQRCHDAIHQKNVSLPSTYLRLDVSHFVSSISRWKCLEKNRQVRRFYLRCLSKAYQISNIQELTEFIEAIVTLTMSKYVGYATNMEELPSQRKLQLLNNKIKGVASDLIDKNDMGFNKDDITDGNKPEKKTDDDGHLDERNEIPPEIDNCKNDWKALISNIYDKAAENAMLSSEPDVGVISAYFNDKFADRLKRQLLPYVAIWTGVMRPIFKTGSTIATSASVESEFNDIKNRMFKGELPMRIDRFVFEHLQRIEDKLILLSKESDVTESQKTANEISLISCFENTDIVNSTGISTKDLPFCSTKVDESWSQDKTAFFEGTAISDSEAISIRHNVSETSGHIKTVDNLVSNNWIIEEDWRGLSCKNRDDDQHEILPKKRNKVSYLDDVPEWDFISAAKIGRIPILRNGSSSKTLKIRGITWNITRTCAFDSIFQLTLNGFSSNCTYRQSMDSSDNPLNCLVKDVMSERKILLRHYTERANILISLGSSLYKESISTFTRNIKRFDCDSNVAHLAQYLFDNDPSYSVIYECSCGYKKTKKHTFISTNINMLLAKGFPALQDAIADCILKMISCYQCKQRVLTQEQYGSHLLIDTSFFNDHQYDIIPKDSDYKEHTLTSIPKALKLKNKSYFLVGVVHYLEIGHYVAYVLSGVRWYKYDDLCERAEIANEHLKIQPHLIMYAISSSKDG